MIYFKNRTQVPYSDDWVRWYDHLTSHKWTPYNISYHVISLDAWVVCDPNTPNYMIVPHETYQKFYDQILKDIKNDTESQKYIGD